MVNKIPELSRDKVELKSKNYVLTIKVKLNSRDGEYFDILLIKKEGNKRTHYGLVPELGEDGKITERTFFMKGEENVKSYSKIATNIKTGEIVDIKGGIVTPSNKPPGAFIKHSIIWNPRDRKLYLEKISIIDQGKEGGVENLELLSKKICILPKVSL